MSRAFAVSRTSRRPLLALSVGAVALVTSCDPGPRQPLTEADVTAFLGNLDAAIATGDAATYFDRFERMPPGQRKFVERLVAPPRTPGVRVLSKALGFTVRDDLGIAHVATTFSRPDASASGSPASSAVASVDTVLVLEKRDDRVRGVLQWEIDAKTWGVTKKHELNCEPCNYHIAAPDDWILTLQERGRTECTEALTCFSVAYDVSVQVAVVMNDPDPGTATEVLTDLVGDGHVHAVEPWIPPAYADGSRTLPDGATTARVSTVSPPGEVMLLVHGGTQYMLSVIGEASHCDSAAGSIAAVLESFYLLDDRLDPATVRGTARHWHTGGRIDDANRYTNDKAMLSFQAPEAWIGTMFTDSYKLHVEFKCPLGQGTVSLRAVQASAGVAWSADAADEMLGDAIRERGYTLSSASEDWQSLETRTPFDFRLGRNVILENPGSDEPHKRRLSGRVLLADDVVVVLVAHGSADGRSVALMAFDSLRRSGD